MSLFDLFKKKSSLPALPDFSTIKVDIHSHLIPGIDDGAQTMEETLGMLFQFSQMGYKKVITTPHVMSDQYQNTPEIILGGLTAVKEEIEKAGIQIEIEAAAEYYLDEFLPEKIVQKNILTFGDNYLLFELSFTTPPNLLDSFIFTAKTNGYNPIIAHFERYPYYFQNGLEKLNELRNKGVLIQMNALSLTGHYGPYVKKQAELMVKNNFVDVLGSDAHRVQHLHLMDKLLTNKYFTQVVSKRLLNKSLM